VGEVKAQATRCSGSLDPGIGRHVVFLDSLHFGDGGDEVTLFTEGGIAPAVRRDFGDGLEAFLARAHRVFVGRNAHGIGIVGAACAGGTAEHALLGVLRHGVFAEERDGRSSSKQAGHAAEIAAGKATVQKGIV
jgi:hypothetical protein